MVDLAIERVFEESHIRRGRLATSPVFYVRTLGWRWSFTRRKDAQRFINLGGTCEEHLNTAYRCEHCLGWRYPDATEPGGAGEEPPFSKQPDDQETDR